ncbi:cingulin-like isoform X2 [Mya arenaria]|uniref:cingulin-like isoform X2 n=1 Tax=Mya arenaria TaxID=6604 RepID=UPI0022DF76F8|nr:cingulin-like isoform X2 [Mya arenaria]
MLARTFIRDVSNPEYPNVPSINKNYHMALLRKLLGRKQHSLDNSKNVLQKHEEEKAVVTNTIDNTPNEINESTTSVSIQSEKKQHRRNATQRRHKKLTTEFIPFLIKDAEVSLEGSPQENPDEVSKDTCEYDSDDEDVTSSSEFEEFLVRNRHKWMEAKLRRLRRQRDKLRRRQDEVILLEKEVKEVVTMVNRTRQQTSALNEEVMDKKCELKFLASQVPENYETEVKKKEPCLYKRYTAAKTVADAQAILNSVREKIEALNYFELLAYNRVLEHQHGLKRDNVKNAYTRARKKNRHFDLLNDVMKYPTSRPNSPRKRTAPTPVEDDADENNNEEENQPLITMVTIETSPITPSTPEMIQSAQTTPLALLQPRTLVGQFPLPLESFI